MKNQRKYLLRTAFVRELLEKKHMGHNELARSLPLSKSYLSQVINRRRALSPRVRRRLLENPLFAGLAEGEIWEVVEIPLPQCDTGSASGCATLPH